MAKVFIDGGAVWVNENGSLTFKPQNIRDLIAALESGASLTIFPGDKSKNARSPDWKIRFAKEDGAPAGGGDVPF